MAFQNCNASEEYLRQLYGFLRSPVLHRKCGMNTMQALGGIWEQVKWPTITVVGDIILDRYIWTTADRISPEAPVPVLMARSEECRLGGAASVAYLLASLEISVQLAGVVGDDSSAERLRQLLSQHHIGQGAVLEDASRQTTVKERILGQTANRQPHQIVRIDREDRHPVSSELDQRMLNELERLISGSQVVLVSDYGKGVVTEHFLARLRKMAAERNLPLIVDPAKERSFDHYRGLAVITPNRAEAQAASGLCIDSIEAAIMAASQLCHRYELQSVVLKLDSDGIVVFQSDGHHVHVPSRQRDVCDVTGAGDMVTAMIGLCLASGIDLIDSARIANVAAGLEVEHVGVTAIRREAIQQEINWQGQPFPSVTKIITSVEAQRLANLHRQSGRKIALASGGFEGFHVGHLHYLEQAASLGDALFVAVSSEHTQERNRPFASGTDRTCLVAGLNCVDHVVLCDEAMLHELVNLIHPDVLVTETEDRHTTNRCRETVKEYGGEIKNLVSLSDDSLPRFVERDHHLNTRSQSAIVTEV